jgi:glycine dehydrogenase subunit 1
MAACVLAKQKLSELDGISLPHIALSHFNEFVIELPRSAADCLKYLDSVGIIGGFDLNRWYEGRNNWLLVSVTDQTKAAEIELLATHLAVWCSMKEVIA